MSRLDIDSFAIALIGAFVLRGFSAQPAAGNSVSWSRVGRSTRTSYTRARGGNNNDRIDREDRGKHCSVVGVVGWFMRLVDR